MVMRRRLDKLLWRNFRTLFRFSTWIRQRFTHLGRLLLTLLFITAIVGIDTNNALSYQLFALVSMFLFVSVIYSVLFRGVFSLQRRLPKYCSVGETFEYGITLTNLGNKALDRLSMLDMSTDPRPAFEQFHRTREPRYAAGNVFDRFFRYPRWAWMIRQNTLANITIADVPDVAPGQSVDLTVEMTPLRRGKFHFAHTEIYRHDHMNIYRARKIVRCPESVWILPKRYRIPQLQLPGKRQHNKGGVSNAGSVGDTEEFVSLREYRPGDSIRKIHWKSWAKTNQPIVKQYQEEYFSRHGLILDTFGSDTSEACFEEGVALAASFVSTLHTEDTLVDLMFVSNKAYRLTMGRGLNQAEQLLEVLASVSPQQRNRIDELYLNLKKNINLLSSAIVILLHYDDERRKMIELFNIYAIPYKIFVIHPAGTNVIQEHETDDDIIHLNTGQIEAGLSRL